MSPQSKAHAVLFSFFGFTERMKALAKEKGIACFDRNDLESYIDKEVP